MITTLYRGSVKDLKGPVRAAGKPGVVFEYTDAYSVFDWGRMPDLLPRKGEALAILAADWFERLEKPETWKEFSKSPEALELRKGNRFGSVFNELGEELQAQGLRTHYLGVLPALPQAEDVAPIPLSDARGPVRHVVVRQVSVVKPEMRTVLGRQLPDYMVTRNAPAPRLVPLEVVFRFGLPKGSSLFERAQRDPGYMASIGFADAKVEAGHRFPFPILELFTKLETTDRPVNLTEALAISGISAPQLQAVLLKTAWVAGLIKSLCSRHGVELADGKLEWAVDEDGGIFLVDAIGPDELRLLAPAQASDSVQLSKEFLRTHYRRTPWFDAIAKAKQQARAQGVAEWKKLVAEGPPPLPAEARELASQVYLALVNTLTGREWFQGAWSLERVISELRKVSG